MVGPETKNLSQRSGWRPKTHSHCRINCEKLVEGWLRSHPSILLYGGLMEEQKSFTQRVKETVIHCAYLYKKYYVEYEYLLCSKAFEKSDSLPKIMNLFSVGTLVEEDFEKNRIRC